MKPASIVDERAVGSSRTKQRVEAGEPPAAAATGEILIGRKLKQARLGRGMLLRELAERCDLSESLISKIENDKAIPSLTSLHRLATALDTNVSWLLTDDSSAKAKIVMRNGERSVIRSQLEKEKIESFVPYGGAHLLQAFLITIEPGGGSRGAREHPGEEAGFIVEGDFELTVGGTTYRLTDGDSFNFRSELPHSYRNPGKRNVRIVWVNTPPTL